MDVNRDMIMNPCANEHLSYQMKFGASFHKASPEFAKQVETVLNTHMEYGKAVARLTSKFPLEH